MEKSLKRLLSFAVALVMVLGMVPFHGLQVFATEAESDLTINTVEDLKSALTEGGEIQVSADITVDEALTIPENAILTINEGKTLRVLDSLTNNGTINGAGKVAVSVMVYVVEEKENYNVTATKNGAITGNAPECAVAYEISLDGGNTWITDTTNGKAQAVLVKTDGTATAYASFQSAFTTAKTGETVHMLTDARVQSTNPKKNNGPLRSYYGLILEGNGHTIYTDLESNGASNEYSTIKFTSYLAGTGPEVNPVLKNVTIDSQNNAKADLDFVSGDVTFTVTMYNVNLLGNCQYPTFAFKSSSMIINKSNVAIYDCTIPSWDAGSANRINLYSGKYSLSLNSMCTVYGGTYTKDVSQYVAEGCECVKNADGTYTVTADPAYGMVAQIGDTYYATLQPAIDAANAGDTIKLIKNVTLTEGVTVAADKTITLDLNGKTITGKPVEAKAFSVITNKGDLTITGNGSVVCDLQLAGSTGYAVNTITNGGTLTIDGATIENKSTATNQIGYAIDNNSTTGDAILVIKNGEVKASGSDYYDGIRLFCNNLTKENSISVEGGTVSSIWLQNPSDGTAEKDTKDVKGFVSITGGTVNALYLEPSAAFDAEITGGYVGKVEYFTTSEGRDLTGFITGGTFGMDVTAYCAPGYKAVNNGDGTYGVVVNEDIVAWNMQTGVECETVAEALLDAKENETVQLLADTVEADAVIVIRKNRVLDLNGYTLTADEVMTSTTGSRIKDSTNGKGLLKVAKENLTLVTNDQMLVWVEEDGGYRFAGVTFTQKVVNNGNGTAQFRFYLNGEDPNYIIANELADGSEDNDGLMLRVRMTYKNSRGSTMTLYFDFPSADLMDYGAGWPDLFLWMNVAGLDTVSDVTFAAVISNGAVEVAGEPIAY